VNIALVLSAFTELNVVQDPCQCPVNDRSLRPYFQTRGLLGGRSRLLGKPDDGVPAHRRREANDRGGRLHLFVRPEGPANVILFEDLDKLRNPLIGVFTRLSEPDGHVVLITEVDISRHGRLLGWSVIAVKSVYSVLVERRSEDGKISVLLGAAEDKNVAVVDLTNGRGQTLVERLKRGVEASQPGIVGDSLVK
jgi:hypothetical protein